MFEVAGAFACEVIKLDQKVIFVKNPACPYDPNAIEAGRPEGKMFLVRSTRILPRKLVSFRWTLR